MRLVIDTNILVSALLAATSLPAQLVVLWRADRFDLLTAVEQLDELMRVTRYPKIRERLPPAIAGRLVNCQVAEHCWDPVGLAIAEYAYRFQRLHAVSRQG